MRSKSRSRNKGKKILLGVLCVIILIVAFIFYIPKVKPVGDKAKGDIRIMSYNLKYSSSDYESWEKRKVIIADQILRYMPDSLGIQEGDEGWMRDSGGLPDLLKEKYSYVGVGRTDGKTRGEYAAVFYLKEKFEVMDSGTFWISQNQDQPSIGWDAVDYRICTWAKLKNKETGEVYTHFNTHLDHVGKEARMKGAELLLEKLEDCETPAVLTGDFNVLQWSKEYKVLAKSKTLDDAKYIAEDSMSYGTINWFYKLNFRFFLPIDFCFVSRDSIEVSKYRVDNTYYSDDKPVSDHYPVIVDMKIKNK